MAARAAARGCVRRWALTRARDVAQVGAFDLKARMLLWRRLVATRGLLNATYLRALAMLFRDKPLAHTLRV